MKKKEKIEGTVFAGRGEGSYFVGLIGYLEQFINKLGIKPYPGTLNLRVNSVESNNFFGGMTPLLIEGFNQGERDFGEILCYKIRINDIIGYAIIPQRSHYRGDTIEIISEHFLRDKLGVKDGKSVIIEKGE